MSAPVTSGGEGRDGWRLLKAVVDGIDDGITLQDQTGRLLFANAGAARILGFPTAEALLTAPVTELMERFEVFTEAGLAFPAEQLPGRAALQGRSSEEVLLRFRVRATNESRWSVVRAHPIFDVDGQVIQAVNVFRDVTDRRREEGRERFLLEAAAQLSSSIDYQATLVKVAKQAVPALADWCAVDMLEGDELKRLAVAHVDPDKLAFVEEIERRYPSDPYAPGSPRYVMGTGKPFLIESIPLELLRASAQNADHLALIEGLSLRSYLAVPIVARSRPLGVLTLAMAESGRTYDERDMRFALALADRAAVSLDNARLFREMEGALAREKLAREEAERATRFSETFIGVLGHDLRNPLAAINSFAQLLLRTASDDQQRRPASRILASTERITRMIDQLLDFTRIRLGGGLAIEPSRLNLAELVRQITEETEAAHACTIELVRDEDVVGTWDGDRLAQVLSNLLANAVQHGAGGPVRLHLDGRDAATVRLEIRNRGEIPADLLPHIFEPLRGSRYQHSAARGLGLGLYITREIVRAHGGSLTATTADGSTSFHVELPRIAKPHSGGPLPG